MKKQINPERIIQMLNELIETGQHGQQSFAAAAEQLTVAALRNFCAEQSRLRAQFTADLQDEMASFNQNKENNGFHRNSGAAIFTEDDLRKLNKEQRMVAACQSADAVILYQYEQALTYHLPATLRSVIEHQYRSIKRAQHQIKALAQSSYRFQEKEI